MPAKKLGGIGIAADVTDPDAVRAAFDRVATRFGGVDIVVSNAGAAWQGRIGEVDPQILRDSFELNFWAHQRVAQNAVRIMRAQRTGGVPAVQRLETGGEPRRRFRALRHAEGGDLGADAAIRARLRRRTASAPTPSTPTASAAGC